MKGVFFSYLFSRSSVIINKKERKEIMQLGGLFEVVCAVSFAIINVVAGATCSCPSSIGTYLFFFDFSWGCYSGWISWGWMDDDNDDQ